MPCWIARQQHSCLLGNLSLSDTLISLDMVYSTRRPAIFIHVLLTNCALMPFNNCKPVQQAKLFPWFFLSSVFMMCSMLYIPNSVSCARQLCFTFLHSGDAFLSVGFHPKCMFSANYLVPERVDGCVFGPLSGRGSPDRHNKHLYLTCI